MHTTALVLGVLGAIVTLTAAVWLAFGFDSENPRYTDDGPLYPGQQRSTVVPNLLADQRKVSALAVAGAAVQLLAVVFGLLA